MISAIITAAGRNRRMEADQKKLGLTIQNKLLLDLQGKPIILKTLDNVIKTGVNESVLVLGHFGNEIENIIPEFSYKHLKIIYNQEKNIQLSQTLLNGVNNIKKGLCLCVAADQPTVSTLTMKNLLNVCLKNPNDNMVSILAREETGPLNSTKGLGMPFVCHSELLKKYLPGKNDNLNPILGEMINDGILFYGVPPQDELELININRWNDYQQILKSVR